MNNQIKIIQESDKFVGYLLTSGEVVFRTPPCSDAATASKLVSEHLKVQSNLSPVPVTANSFTVPETHLQSTPMTSIPTPHVQQKSGGCGCRRG
jgi:hypothetical protein